MWRTRGTRCPNHGRSRCLDLRSDGAPRLPRSYVPRPRLWRALDGAVDGSVTLLVAPAGAGKTLGVGGWVAQPTRPDQRRDEAIWIQADSSWQAERLASLLDGASRTRGDSTLPAS